MFAQRTGAGGHDSRRTSDRFRRVGAGPTARADWGRWCNDLLAIAPDGALVLIELKQDRTPPEVVVQPRAPAHWCIQAPPFCQRNLTLHLHNISWEAV